MACREPRLPPVAEAFLCELHRMLWIGRREALKYGERLAESDLGSSFRSATPRRQRGSLLGALSGAHSEPLESEPLASPTSTTLRGWKAKARNAAAEESPKDESPPLQGLPPPTAMASSSRDSMERFRTAVDSVRRVRPEITVERAAALLQARSRAVQRRRQWTRIISCVRFIQLAWRRYLRRVGRVRRVGG